MKQIIIGVIAVVAILGGAIIFGKNDDTSTSDGAPSNYVYGNPDAEVTLVEYGDFECPACGAFFPIVEQIKEEYKDKIRFEFRHFPLVQIHQNAQAAHRAAQAAGNQGKFWEMYTILYERQANWRSNGSGSLASSVFEGYAEEIGLDVDRFKADVAASDTLATINADVERGKADGVEGTPSFFLNGKKIEDTTTIDTIEEFRAIINEALGLSSDTSEAEQAPQSTEATPTAETSTESEETPVTQ